MVRRLSTDPRGRMGVYKHIDDVPNRRRLYHHAAAYADRDVWAEFRPIRMEDYDSTRFADDYDRTGRYWKEHMGERGRHHALATPEDVETFAASLFDRMNPTSLYNGYWTHLEAFYGWLMRHTEHPHVYNPVLMAAAEYADGAAGQVWKWKISTNDKR